MELDLLFLSLVVKRLDIDWGGNLIYTFRPIIDETGTNKWTCHGYDKYNVRQMITIQIEIEEVFDVVIPGEDQNCYSISILHTNI